MEKELEAWSAIPFVARLFVNLKKKLRKIDENVLFLFFYRFEKTFHEMLGYLDSNQV